MRTEAVNRAAALLLCIMLCLTMGSCSLADQLRVTFAPLSREKGIPGADELTYTDTASAYTASPYYTALCSRYAYDTLTEGQRALYDGLLACADTVADEADDYAYPTPQVILDGVLLSNAAISVAICALCDDNPYIFWTAQAYTYLVDEDAGYTAVQLYSVYPPDEVIAMKKELDSVLSDFYASVPEGLSIYERERSVHDYLIAACDYDSADLGRTELTPENLKSHSVYGALVEKLCVCEGYGTAMQLLLNGLGIECVTLTGEAYNSSAEESESEKVLHLWDAVKLDDGCWYHVDPTWDDQENAAQQYNYFNLDDEVLFTDHTLSPTPDVLTESYIEENGTEDMNFYIPSCDATTYNYYVFEFPHLTGYDAASLCDSLCDAAKAEEEVYVFYVEPTLGYDRAVSALFQEEQTFFDLLGRVNERLCDVEVDRSNLTYYLNESRRSVAVELKYY